jgi:ribose transport system permease protein
MNDVSAASVDRPRAGSNNRKLIQALQTAKLPIVLAAIVLIFAAIEPTMLSTGNIRNMLIQASYLVIFASAQMIVIVVRGFDLSLGTTVSTISVASAMVMVNAVQGGTPADSAVALGVLAGFFIGIVIGLVNGLVVSYLRVNPFVATFGMLNICLGLSSSLSGGFQIFDLPTNLNAALYQKTVVGVPMPIIIAGLVLVLCYGVLVHSRFGRSLFILGTNPRAATVAGHNSQALLVGAYVMCSLLAAIGAVLLTARTGSGEPNMGGSLMLESIAAAVIGGISLRGGQASVLAPVMGALIITALSAGMNLSRIDGYIQQVLLGLVIIATVFLDQGRKNRT